MSKSVVGIVIVSVLFVSSLSLAHTCGHQAAKLQESQEIQVQELFKEDLSNAIMAEGAWIWEDGRLTRMGKGDIWTTERYGDFELELEFKTEQDTNSGVFIRCGDIANWLHTCMEVQILQDQGRSDKHSCGAIYDILEPTRQMLKDPGEWNHYKITAVDNKVTVIFNGEQVIDLDLDLWTEAGKNPDGTTNKFHTAYKDMPREGHIGLQDHGHPVWFRNLRIRALP